MTSFGANSFNGCTSPVYINIINCVTTISFSFETLIAKVHPHNVRVSDKLPDTITSIGINAFERCSSLLNILIPSKVTAIQDKTFSRCSKLIEVSIQGKIKTNNSNIFSRCSSFSSI